MAGDEFPNLDKKQWWWWRRIRRGLGIPDVVPRGEAWRAVRRRIENEFHTTQVFAEKLMLGVVNLAAEGRLSDAFLPEGIAEFSTASDRGEWGPLERVLVSTLGHEKAERGLPEGQTKATKYLIDALVRQIEREQQWAEARGEISPIP